MAIHVNIQSRREYDVNIGSINELPDYIEKKHKGKKVIVVTDDAVKRLYEKTITTILYKFNPLFISVAPGEDSKTRETKEKIEDFMLERCGKDTIVIALGGGVVGDLAGFVAATFNRGIPWIYVPTTLLAMADASIGGKTGINTDHGKNMIGAIWQPDAVYSDPEFLNTLSREEFLNGLSEIFKIAVVLDKRLFDYIDRNSSMISDKKVLGELIKRAIELKKGVVEKDEVETGYRQVLNFGHTFGHGYERYCEYKVKHGLCIAKGVVVETNLSALGGYMKPEEGKRIIGLMAKLGLPSKIEEVDITKMIDFMKKDKKSMLGRPRFVTLRSIGKPGIITEVEDSLIVKSIHQSE